MKRIVYTLFMSGALLLACATPTENENLPEESQETESAENIEEEEANAEAMTPATEDEIEQAESVSEFSNYEEIEYQDIFNPDEYEAHLITDNPGTRVFIFRDGEQQAYKTIYIKSENRLKLINIANNEMLLNEVIN